MNEAQQLLAQLRDIHLPLTAPAHESMSPPLLLLALSAILLVALLLAWKWRQRKLHSMLARLRRIARRFRQDGDMFYLTTAVNALLRQQARMRDPGLHVGSLAGRAWRDYLEQRGGAMPDATAQMLVDGPYLPRHQLSMTASTALLAYTEAWLRINSR